MEVRVETVLIIDSATLAVGIGIVDETGERVIFGVPKADGRGLLDALGKGTAPVVDVEPSGVLRPDIP